MTNQLYEKAKQAVAEKHDRESWEDFMVVVRLAYDWNIKKRLEELDNAYQEVAEWMCNEAVKAVINDVIGQADDIIAWVDQYPKRLEEQYYSSGKVNASEIIKKFCRDRPLPFPQQPDER